ncbi:MAG: hypothetical protein AAF662_03100 [Pseudomonadota bacterium]
MTNGRSYPDSISIEEKEHDSRIAAEMYLFLSKMVKVATEEKRIDDEHALDLLMCSVVQLYTQEFETTPRGVGAY